MSRANLTFRHPHTSADILRLSSKEPLCTADGPHGFLDDIGMEYERVTANSTSLRSCSSLRRVIVSGSLRGQYKSLAKAIETQEEVRLEDNPRDVAVKKKVEQTPEECTRT